MIAMTAADWIAHLQLTPHPEGGYFRRMYTASLALHPPDRDGPRPLLTAIHYLLPAGQYSRLHRLKSDELWFFQLGAPLSVHVLDSRGDYRRLQLGGDPAADQQVQGVVHAGCWFGAGVESDDPAAFSLVTCTVAPGFDFADFELADRALLIAQYPRHAALITQLT